MALTQKQKKLPKALQEAITEIETLKTKVSALEGS